MVSFFRFIFRFQRMLTFIACVGNLALAGAPITAEHELSHRTAFLRETSVTPNYTWNIGEKRAPLLALPEQLQIGIDQSLAFPIADFRFAIFQPLNYDDQHDKYSLSLISQAGATDQFLEFARQGTRNVYSTLDAPSLELTDNGNVKIIRTSEGTRYLFVRYPDGELRCAAIKDSGGSYISLNYTANGVLLHGIGDSFGRTVTFNYSSAGIRSITQTWMQDSEGMTKTWTIGDVTEPVTGSPIESTKGVRFVSVKSVPTNALLRQYTSEMAASDRTLAEVFGGPGAVAAANGFEPAGLAAAYPFYRGDIMGMDGKLRRGHLSYAMHLYGSADGRSETALYVPAGFSSHSAEPSPTDAVVTFYYPRLGNLTDVTLAVFHVADFKISFEGERVRIGNIGGPGGSSPLYKHSHIEFYKGNASLPCLAARSELRINPSSVFNQAMARKEANSVGIGQQ